MRQLNDIAERIRAAICRLNDNRCETQEEAADLVEFLRQESTSRESMLVLRADTLKETLSESAHDQDERYKIDSIVYDVIKEIEDSGYVDGGKKISVAKPKSATKTRKSKPKKAFSEALLTKAEFRFVFSKDFAYVRDCVHTADKGYKIDMYEGLKDSPVVVEAIKELLKAVRVKKSEGWWIHGSSENWRGAFQRGVYKRFYSEQIQRGSKKNGHLGQWRFITNAEFDELSLKGKFFKRKQA